MELTCNFCKTTFKRPLSKYKRDSKSGLAYCSKNCLINYNKKEHIESCNNCNTEFIVSNEKSTEPVVSFIRSLKAVEDETGFKFFTVKNSREISDITLDKNFVFWQNLKHILFHVFRIIKHIKNNFFCKILILSGISIKYLIRIMIRRALECTSVS